jgi:uncharacterized protein with HEPN domain
MLIACLEMLTDEPCPPPPTSSLIDDRIGIVALYFIALGETTEAIRRQRGISRGVDPWRSLADLRNVLAHEMPWSIRPDILWNAARHRLDEVRTTVAD